jgi:hypothetical protein
MNAKIFPIVIVGALTLTGCPFYPYNSYSTAPGCDTVSPVNFSVSREYVKAGDNVTLVATQGNSYGTDCPKIQKVQFFNGETLIGEATNTFALIWTLKAGEKGIPADAINAVDLPLFAKGFFADGKATPLTNVQYLRLNQTAPAPK